MAPPPATLTSTSKKKAGDSQTSIVERYLHAAGGGSVLGEGFSVAG
jgi:hypothetical protein